jgi:hypothetical protein
VDGVNVAVAPVGRPVTLNVIGLPTVGGVTDNPYVAVPPGEAVCVVDPPEEPPTEKLSITSDSTALVTAPKFVSPE